MKKFSFILVLLTAFQFLYSDFLFTQWTAMSEPITTSINAFTQRDKYLVIGTSYYGVYTYDLEIGEWYHTSLLNKTIRSLSTSGIYIYAGTDDGVYSSGTAGVMWTHVLTGEDICCLTDKGSYVFAGANSYPTSTGIWYTSNNGYNWSGNIFGGTQCLASNSTYLFAGCTSEYSINRTANLGTNWDYNALGSYVTEVATNGNTVFINLSGIGIQRSMNNMATFSTVLADVDAYCITTVGNYIFLGTGYGVYYSPNNGTNWYTKNQGFPATPPEVMALSMPAGTGYNYIYAGTSTGAIYRRYSSEIVSTENTSSEIPEKFKLEQNYPNPFNPKTKIEYSMPFAGNIKLVVYDMLGKEVSRLVDEFKQPGKYSNDWDASNLPSGTYLYQLTSGKNIETRKMVLVR